MVAGIEGMRCVQPLGHIRSSQHCVCSWSVWQRIKVLSCWNSFNVLELTPSSEDGQRQRCPALHWGHGALFPWLWPFCCYLNGNCLSCWGLSAWLVYYGMQSHLKWAKHKRRMWPSCTAVSVWLSARVAPFFPVGLFQYSTVRQPLNFSLWLTVQKLLLPQM